MKKGILNKNSRLLFAAVFLAALAYMFFINMLTPYISDDFVYTMRTQVTLQSFIQEQVDYYLLWGGRVVAHSIAQFFLLLDKIWFNMFNSLVFMLNAYLIYRISSPKASPPSAARLLAVLMALWFFTPAFGQVYLWSVGASHYQWGMPMYLGMIYIYKAYLLSTQNISAKANARLCAVVVPLGLLGGNFLENASPACAVLLVLMVAYKRIKKQQVPLFAYIGAAAMLLGFAALLLSPGSIARAELVSDTAQNTNIFLSLLSRLAIATYRLKEVFLVMLAALALLMVKLKHKDYQSMVLPAMLLAAALLANYAMVAVSAYPERAMYPVAVFSILSLLVQLFAIDFGQYTAAKNVVYAAVCLMFAVSVVFGTFDIAATYKADALRRSAIIDAAAQGADYFETYTIIPMTKYSPMYQLEDINLPGEDVQWVNGRYITKYGISEIVATKIAYRDWGTVLGILMS